MPQPQITVSTWCDQKIVTFEDGTPSGIKVHSEECANIFLDNAFSSNALTEKTSFVSPQHWALYWTFARASSEVCGEKWTAVSEDGLTNRFVSALKDEIEKANSSLDDEARIDIAVSPIFEHVLPAVKEAAVGADLLLLVETETFSDGGGPPIGTVRLFWLQAKALDARVNDRKAFFTLDYSRKNTRGYQVEALRKVHDPSKGSFGFYAQYSRQVNFVPVIGVDQLPSATLGKFDSDLGENGTRLAEWLVALISPDSAGGGFAGIGEVKDFLDRAADRLPYVIVTLSARRGLRAEPTMEVLSRYYQEKIDGLLTPPGKPGAPQGDPERIGSDDASAHGDTRSAGARPDPAGTSEATTEGRRKTRRPGAGKG